MASDAGLVWHAVESRLMDAAASMLRRRMSARVSAFCEG
jgi:hypothetical protein